MAERLIAWLYTLAKRYWVTLTLMAGLISVLVYSLESANWVRDESALSMAFLTGVAFGYLLARSRFSGWFALPYALMISLVVSAEAAGKILPSSDVLFSRPFAATMEQMNLRIVSFSLRITGWIETLRGGSNVEDPGLFVLLLSAMLSLCGVWLVWAMMRRRSILLGVLPVGLLYAMNVHLSRQSLTSFMFFLLCVLLLVVRTEYNRQHEEWQRRQVDYPEQLGLEWGGAAVAIVLLIVMLSRAAPLFGTIEGWRAISEWVNRANQGTEDTATRLFSGVNPPPPDPADDTVFVSTPNLLEIGEPIPQGDRTIMWVGISDPAPPPRIGYTSGGAPVPARIHYWRSGIYGNYTGRGWQELPKSEKVVDQQDLPQSEPAGRYYLRQNYQMEARHSGVLFSVSDPVQSNNGVHMRQVLPDGSRLAEGQAEEYQVISAATKVSATQLAEASTAYPEDIRAAYLQLPGELPERVRTLANRITGGEPDAYHKALKFQSYLRENYEYDLNVPDAPKGRDVVDYFLFEMPGGFCSHYASSMVVLLRTQGVPARVATGYAMGDYDPERGAFRVPESNAHAWVEVYFPEYGWVEFEPTVARSPIVYSEEAPAQQEPIQVTNLEEKPALQAQPYFIALVLLGALLILAMPFVLLQMFSTSHQPAPVQVSSLYRRMRRTLSWAGFSAVGSVTPDEYLALYGDRLESYPVLRQALQQATVLYRESEYSPRPPDDRRVRGASLLWRRSFREWITLWLRVRWRRLRERLVNG